MTDEAPASESPASDQQDVGAVATLDAADVPDGGALDAQSSGSAPAVVEPEQPTVWNRFGSPLLIPVLVALFIVCYVLLLSRIFLAGDGWLAVVFATIITLSILIGASVLANSHMRGSSLTLSVVGGLFIISMLGMVSIGGAEFPEEEVVELPDAIASVPIESGDLYFRPNTAVVPVGVIEFDVNNASGTHTLTFQDGGLAGGPTVVEMPGAGEYSGKVQFTEPGTYAFFCATAGHAASMNGTIEVSADAPAPAAPGTDPETGEPTQTDEGVSVDETPPDATG